MTLYEIIVSGLVGVAIGSFLNVLIGRYQELETVVATRSHCPSCRKKIKWYDLVPLLSFVLLRARCRYCHERISWQYPFIELLTALLAVHLYSVFGLTWLTFVLFAIFCLLLVVAVIDWRDMVVPDEFVWPAILLSLVVAVVRPTDTPLGVVGGVLLAGGGLALLVIVSRGRWMGAGDIGLGIILGLLAGWLGSVAGLVFAFVAGSIVGLLAMVSRHKSLRDKVAFGPYLVVATYLATIYGQDIAMQYLTFVRFY